MSDMELVERFKRLPFPHDTVLKLVSVLLWIQVAVEVPDLLKTILLSDDNLFSFVANEAEGLLGFLSSPATDPYSLSFSKLQTLVASGNGYVSIIHLLDDRERIRAFVDAKYRMLLKREGKKVRDGSSGDGESRSPDSHPSKKQSRQTPLNPAARPFVPIISIDGGTEDDRCLYLTFSKGHPLTSSEIVEFFNEMCNNYGGGRENPNAVKTVYIHKGEDGMTLFGKVVFCNPYLPGFILGTEEEIKFVVNGRTLWCKKFVRKNFRNSRMEYHQGGSSTQVGVPQGVFRFAGTWYENGWGGQHQVMGYSSGNPQLAWPHVVGAGAAPGWPVTHFLQPTGQMVVVQHGPPPQGVGYFGGVMSGHVHAPYYHGMMGRGWGGL